MTTYLTASSSGVDAGSSAGLDSSAGLVGSAGLDSSTGLAGSAGFAGSAGLTDSVGFAGSSTPSFLDSGAGDVSFDTTGYS